MAIEDIFILRIFVVAWLGSLFKYILGTEGMI